MTSFPQTELPDGSTSCGMRCVPRWSNWCFLLPSFSSLSFQTMTVMTSPMRTTRATSPCCWSRRVSSSTPWSRSCEQLMVRLRPTNNRSHFPSWVHLEHAHVPRSRKNFRLRSVDPKRRHHSCEEEISCRLNTVTGSFLCDTVRSSWVVPCVPSLPSTRPVSKTAASHFTGTRSKIVWRASTSLSLGRPCGICAVF